jgi:hypothetical protein
MDQTEIATKALAKGETTSEYATMQEGSKIGRILTIIGVITGFAPQLADLLNMLPESVAQSKYGVIGFAVIGGVFGILGVVKEMLVKIAYVQSRALVKAAALRDVKPNTTVES